MSEEEAKQTNGAETPAQTDGTDNEKQTAENKTPKTFTQEDFDRQLSKTLAEKEARLERKMREQLDKEIAERERLAKLSAEEKAAEEQRQREAATAERERQITLRENRAEAREILQDKNISAELVDFVVDVDQDKTKENIETLERAFLKAVEAGVNDRLKGQTPKELNQKTEGKKDTKELLFGHK